MNPKNESLSPKEDFLWGLSTRKQHLIAIVILLVLPVILFNGAVLEGKRFMGHDTVQWRAGAESVIDYRQETGEEALWATNMFSGMPAYVVSYLKSVVHLDTILRDLTKSIFPASFYWVMLIGIYLFFVVQKIRPLTAVLGALFIGFTTYIPIIIGAGHNNKFIAMVFMPWVLLGYWMITRTDRKLLSFFVFATALILEFRANHPQVTYYFIYLLGFWWIYDTYLAYRKEQLKEWSMRSGFIALAIVLAVFGNLQPYWSMYEYTPYTIRGGSAVRGDTGLDLEYAFSWSQGPGEMLTLLIPGLYGGSSGEAYWGLKPGTSGPHYFGAIASVLFILGLALYRNRRKYVFLGVGVLAMLFSLGYHFRLLNELMFEFVPYFDKFRTPEMWLIVTVFCFSVIAVFGLHELIERTRANKRKELTQKVYLSLGIPLAFGLLFALGSSALLSYENPQQRQMIERQIAQQNNLSPDNPQVRQAATRYINSRLKPARKEMAKDSSIRYFILVLLAGGLIFAFYNNKISPGLLVAGLILLGSYDMISVDDRYTNEGAMVSDSVDPEQYVRAQGTPADKFVQENIQSDEAFPYRAFPLDSNPFNNAVPAYFYPSIGGYSGAKLSYYQDMIDRILLSSQRGLNLDMLNMLNVKYVTASRELPFPGYRLVFEEGSQRVYENTNVLPKAFFVDSTVTAGSAREAVGLLQPDSGFDPFEYAVVETDEPVTARSDTAAAVEVTAYDARTIEMNVTRSQPGFMVVSEIYYPEGWRAYIDGEETPIIKTNYILRGIELPAGEHTVSVAFNPDSYTWGSRIAWIGNIVVWGIGIAALVSWYRRREQMRETEVVEAKKEKEVKEKNNE
ncbi:MAG: YfhO family protein [Balneolaceae bacterium]|nr:YfhO family protein [Balneolaceae bacterium]